MRDWLADKLLKDWEQFEDYMETLIKTRTIASIKEVWWDIRPHPTYGTVELRICDGLPTLHEVRRHLADLPS